MLMRYFLMSGWGLIVGYGQLSGIVNAYSAVLAFPGPNQVMVANPGIFNPGDRILIHQAQGATIDQTNGTPSYGDIISIGSAGLFEFNVVAAVTGNVLTLQCPLLYAYGDPATAGIQVVRVSYHAGDVSITGPVTAPAWDGSTGGIVVIETEGTLTFGANIDVRGRGFRGGPRSANQTIPGCGTPGTPNAFHGPISDTAGQKGEGVAIWPDPNHRACRGKIANGGGGGNIHNTGGGGGGGAGNGGQGGWTTCGCVGYNASLLPLSGWGYGGVGLASYNTATTPRAFFGGGGGGGQQNNDESTDGGAGGGIVILRAAQIAGNNFSILAGGAKASRTPAVCTGQPTEAGQDGGGGGGGGGTVVLFGVSNYLSGLLVDVSGAAGGNIGYRVYPPGCAPCTNDHGPGGGGGGGFVLESNLALHPLLTLNLSGGGAGQELTPCQQTPPPLNCTNCANCLTDPVTRVFRGATAGADGTVLTQVSLTPVQACPLAYRPPRSPSPASPFLSPFTSETRRLSIQVSEPTPYLLVDGMGRVIKSGLFLPSERPQVYSLEDLPAGLYLFQLGEKSYRLFFGP